jgi:hypothetical protein
MIMEHPNRRPTRIATAPTALALLSLLSLLAVVFLAACSNTRPWQPGDAPGANGDNAGHPDPSTWTVRESWTHNTRPAPPRAKPGTSIEDWIKPYLAGTSATVTSMGYTSYDMTPAPGDRGFDAGILPGGASAARPVRYFRSTDICSLPADRVDLLINCLAEEIGCNSFSVNRAARFSPASWDVGFSTDEGAEHVPDQPPQSSGKSSRWLAAYHDTLRTLGTTALQGQTWLDSMTVGLHESGVEIHLSLRLPSRTATPALIRAIELALDAPGALENHVSLSMRNYEVGSTSDSTVVEAHSWYRERPDDSAWDHTKALRWAPDGGPTAPPTPKDNDNMNRLRDKTASKTGN